MALDHRRLIRPGKKKHRIFCVPQVYFTKSCQQLWVRVNQPFHHLSEVMFKNITSEIKQYYEALFLIIQTTDRMQYFTILRYKLHSFNIQDDRSTRGPLAKPLKKFLSHLYGQPVLTFAVRSYIIKNLLYLFFIQWFYRCVIFKSF